MILLIFNSRFIFLVEIKFEVYSNDTVLFWYSSFFISSLFPIISSLIVAAIMIYL